MPSANQIIFGNLRGRPTLKAILHTSVRYDCATIICWSAEDARCTVLLPLPGHPHTVATMEYINAADDDSDDVFVDIRDSIHSLHFIFEHFFDESDTREAKWHHRRIKGEAHVAQLQHFVCLSRLLYERMKHERAILYVSIHVVGCEESLHPCLEKGWRHSLRPTFFRVFLRF